MDVDDVGETTRSRFWHRLVNVRSMRCQLRLGRSRNFHSLRDTLIILIRTAGYEPSFGIVSVHMTAYGRCAKVTA